MRRAILTPALLAAALWSAPSLAQPRSQLGPLCTTDTTPADQMIEACNKIIALKVFTGEKLATIYFWRAVGWKKKAITTGHRGCRRGNPPASERRRLRSRGFGLLRQGRGRHRRYQISTTRCGWAAERYHLSQPRQRLALQGRIRQGDRRLRSIDQGRTAVGVFLAEPRHFERALGDLDGALADINEAIRLDPTLPQPLTSRAVICAPGRSRSCHRRYDRRRSGSQKRKRRSTS